MTATGATRAAIAASLAVTPLLSNAQIPPAYLEAARELSVPPAVLYAVALNESGARLPSGRVRPWPWTLNVAGDSHYFPTREDAHAFLVDVLASGRRNVDVGLMQINWRWHGERLIDPWIAFDPVYNVRIGAIILREEYERLGEWIAAAGRYYSPHPDRAARYRARVAARIAKLEGSGS